MPTFLAFFTAAAAAAAAIRPRIRLKWWSVVLTAQDRLPGFPILLLDTWNNIHADRE